jgi:ParB-like chromosome segregation protein Spo0J
LQWLIRELSHDLSHETIPLAFILNFKRGNEKSAFQQTQEVAQKMKTIQTRACGRGNPLLREGEGANRIVVTYRPLSDLKPAPRNPRAHSLRQVRQIARSIKTFGFLVPVLVDRNGNVIAGHGRIMAAELLGLSEVPTICVEHLSEAQIKAFMIADNRLSENSAWDDRLLAEQLQELSVLDLDFSLEVTGFDMGEIDIYIEGLTSEPEDGDGPGRCAARATDGDGRNSRR